MYKCRLTWVLWWQVPGFRRTFEKRVWKIGCGQKPAPPEERWQGVTLNRVGCEHRRQGNSTSDMGSEAQEILVMQRRLSWERPSSPSCLPFTHQLSSLGVHSRASDCEGSLHWHLPMRVKFQQNGSSSAACLSMHLAHKKKNHSF